MESDQLWWNGPHWLTDHESWADDIAIEATRESNAKAKIVRQVFAVALEKADKVNEMLQNSEGESKDNIPPIYLTTTRSQSS